MTQKKIAILLSTYNGERWLPELLCSLSGQNTPFELIWRDDGSEDNSVELVRGFDCTLVTELDHSGPSENMGACASFAVLMEAALKSDADIFFFADQDDIWQPEKLTKVVASFDTFNACCPHLVHHDLRVVDTMGDLISPSLWHYMALTPSATELRQYLTRNAVTGCAAACNRALLEAACPVPESANMHDWWLALVASAIGRITAMPATLVDYRQHSANAIGAKSVFSGLNPFTNWSEGWERGNLEYLSLFPQAAALRDTLEGLLPDHETEMLSTFIDLPGLPRFQRLWTAQKLGLRDRSSLLWLVAMIRIALIDNKR